MPAPSLATLDDLETWMGEPVHVQRAEAILHAASTLIRTRTGRVWVDDGGAEVGVTDLQIAALRSVCVSVAARVYRNPEGRRQEAAGPFSWSVAAWAAAGLTLTDEELGLLPTAPGTINGLSSVRVQAPWGARGSVTGRRRGGTG